MFTQKKWIYDISLVSLYYRTGIKEKLTNDRFSLVQNDNNNNNKLINHGTLVDGSWTTILYYKKGLCLMLAMI